MLAAASLIGHNGCDLLFGASAGIGEAGVKLWRAKACADAVFVNAADTACSRFNASFEPLLTFWRAEVQISVVNHLGVDLVVASQSRAGRKCEGEGGGCHCGNVAGFHIYSPSEQRRRSSKGAEPGDTDRRAVIIKYPMPLLRSF